MNSFSRHLMCTFQDIKKLSIFLKISINSSKGHSTLTYRKFNNFDSARFRYDISTQDWDRVNNYDDPKVMWDIWKNLFFQCIDKHAPLRTKRMHDKNVLKVNNNNLFAFPLEISLQVIYIYIFSFFMMRY